MSEARTRFPQERHRQMMDVIADAKRIGTSDLAGIMGVSLPTLRRDLITLEQAGLILRIHGGVVARGAGEGVAEPMFLEKLRISQSAKARIGEAAAAYVASNSTVILDSGTTALSVARALAGRAITLVTMDLKIAEAAAVGATEVHIIGGRVRNDYYSLIGAWATETLRHIRADCFFLSADCVDLEGVSTSTIEEAEVKRAAIAIAQKTILVADQRKLGCRSFAPVCGLQDLSGFITDSGFEGSLQPYRDQLPFLETV